MEPGIYENLSNEQYHSGPGLSKSSLDIICRSPLHYLAKTLDTEKRDPTPAMVFGTSFHTFMLEPEKFDAEYVLPFVAPENSLNTSDDIKAVLAAAGEKVNGTKPVLIERLKAIQPDAVILDELKHKYAVKNAGRTILKSEDFDKLRNMREAVMAHPAASALMKKPGKSEASIYWTDEKTGELLRCRPDRWTDDGIVIDLKTTEDASPEGFAKSVMDYRYHVQAPFYADGVEAATGRAPRAFVFIAVEKSARVVNGKALGVTVCTLDADSVAIGRVQYRQDLEAFAECKKSGVWPCYGDGLQQISLPGFFIARHAASLGTA